MTAERRDLIEKIYDDSVALPRVEDAELGGGEARLYVRAGDGRHTRTRTKRVIGGSELSVLELGLKGRPPLDVREEISLIAIILQVEVERVRPHTRVQIGEGIPRKLLEVQYARRVRRKVREGLQILLGAVLDDGLVELAVRGDIPVPEEVIPVGKPTLLGEVIGEKNIEMRDAISMVLKSDAIVLETPLRFFSK